MDNVRSSYEFHLEIESLGAFCRREWRAIALFGGGFTLLLLAAIFLIDPAFFYPRLQTDPLNYWLKARALIETGNTRARWAVNLAPFSYAAMPGVIRAPLLLVFNDFDTQLRAIQLLNIPIVAGVALISAYILSWTQPVTRHPFVIAFAFLYTLLNPVWVANVFLPLVDAPYALFTLAAIIVSMRMVTRHLTVRARLYYFISYTFLFTVAFLLRFTAPVLLVFLLALAAGRWRPGAVSKRKVALVSGTAIAALMLLVAFNSNAIFGRYFRELSSFASKGDKLGMLLNVVGAAIPSQLVPNFMQGFAYPPIYEYFKTSFFGTPMQAAWLGVGILIGSVVLVGIWNARKQFLPEILYFLAVLPVLGLMMPSTSRYLKSYQAFVWVFFYIGSAYLYRRYRSLIPGVLRTRTAAIVLLACAALVVAGIRTWRLGGTASEKKFAVTVSSAPRYITDVSDTFRGLRGFLQNLPRDRTLLVSDKGSMGRWTAIAGRQYYSPDGATTSVAAEKDLYLLVECGTMEGCQYWDEWRTKLKKRVDVYGAFEYDLVYEIERPRARAEVYRIRNTQ